MAGDPVHVRPTTPEDIDRIDSELPWRARMWTGEVNGEIVGIGGIGYPPGQTPVAFLDLIGELRHPVTLHKLAKRILEETTEPVLMATIDPADPVAVRWAKRLEFRDSGMMVDGRCIYLWTRHVHQATV